MRSANQAQQMRDFTANFFFWQGLRFVPIGVAILIIAWAWTPYWPFSQAAREVAVFIVLPALILSYLAGLYYRAAYGEVRTQPGLHARRSALKWYVVYPAVAAAILADGVLPLPLSVAPIVFAAALIAYRQSTGGGRRHYLVGAAALAALGVASYFGLVPTGKAGYPATFVAVGLLYTIGGMLDHIEMRRLLRALPRDEA